MAKAKAARDTGFAVAPATPRELDTRGGASPLIGMDQYIANLNSRTPENMVNQAAMRAYTRNAPYMEDMLSSPDKMMSEMRQLQAALQQNPNDPVAEYRLRILRQAMGDVYGVQPPGDYIGYFDRPSGPVTPGSR